MEKNQDKNKEIGRRIAQIRQEFCDGNNITFAAKIGKDPTYTSQLCGGTKSQGKKILELILSVFPEVSRSWLFFGEGEMLRSSSVPAVEATARGERSNSECTAEQVAILRALLEDKERQLAEANQMIGQLRLQLQLEREKTPSQLEQIETERILP